MQININTELGNSRINEHEVLLESIFDLIMVFDSKLELIKVDSGSLTRLLGYDFEDLSSKPFTDVIHGQDRKEFNKFIISLSKSEKKSIILRLQHLDKTYKWFEVKGCFFPDTDKINDLFILGFRKESSERYKRSYQAKMKKKFQEFRKDLTEIKYWKLFQPSKDLDVYEKSQDLLETVMNCIPHYIAWKDKDLNYLGCNQNFIRLIGKEDPHFVIGKQDHDLNWKVDGISKFQEVEKLIIQNGVPEYSKVEKLLQEDGNELYFNINRIPLTDPSGECIGILLTFEDITERRLLEIELEELRMNLEDRIRDRTLKLEDSEKKFQKAYDRVACFKGLFTHDISNMVQTISNTIEHCNNLIRGGKKLDKIINYFSLIDQQLNRGKELIHNISNLSEIEKSGMNLKDVQVLKTLQEAIKFVKLNFHEKNVDVTVHSAQDDLKVKANELLLDVFENLLINSVKYNENENIEIIVDVCKIPVNNVPHVNLQFKDNGIGIEDSKKKSIFVKSKKETKDSNGMGVGLSFVAKLVDLYKGNIQIEDRIEGDHSKGSNFIILLPEFY